MAGAVLDSFAVLVFLFKEKGHQKLIDLFEAAADDDDVALISAPNWAEVRYIVERKVGAARWREVRATLRCRCRSLLLARRRRKRRAP